MKKNLQHIYLVFLLILLSQSVQAEEIQRFRYEDFRMVFGIFAGPSYNMHSSTFKHFRGVLSCCKEFETGSGLGLNGGLFAKYLIDPQWSIRLNLAYTAHQGNFTASEETWVSIDDQAVKGEFEHILDVDLNKMIISPMVSYKFYKDLSANVGFNLITVVANNFKQLERISKPNNAATFLDVNMNNTFKRTRNEFDGEIPDIQKFQMELSAGFSYELPMNKQGNLKLVPAIKFSYALTQMVENIEWKGNRIDFALGLQYRPRYKVEIERENILKDPVYHIDTNSVIARLVSKDTVLLGAQKALFDTSYTMKERIISSSLYRSDTLIKSRNPILEININAIAKNLKQKNSKSNSLVVEEFIYSRSFPLLNYVFFDEHSNIIPARYTQLTTYDTKRFNENKLYQMETMDIYYNLLNLIGKRMQNDNNMKITLQAVENAHVNRNNKDAKERINAIQKYLTETWAIDINRIKSHVRYLKFKADDSKESQEKIEEMRRVEIVSTQQKLLMPVFSRDTIRHLNGNHVKFVPQVIAEVGVKSWMISINQGDKVIKEFSGQGDIPKNIPWSLENSKVSLQKQIPLTYQLSVIDTYKQTIKSDPKALEVELVTLEEKRRTKTKDFELDKYNLILFDFDKSEIKGKNQKIIEFIKKRIKSDSEVSIFGYADQIGESEYNKTLSEQRAQATARALNIKPKELIGYGGEHQLFDNKLPEGRFYCRTVEIKIKTPLKK